MGNPNIVYGFSYHIYSNATTILVNWQKNIIQQYMYTKVPKMMTFSPLAHVWTISAKGIKPNDEQCQCTHCPCSILIKTKDLLRDNSTGYTNLVLSV